MLGASNFGVYPFICISKPGLLVRHNSKSEQPLKRLKIGAASRGVPQKAENRSNINRVKSLKFIFSPEESSNINEKAEAYS